MKAILMALLLVSFPAMFNFLGKDKRVLFASLSSYNPDFDGDGYGDLAVWNSQSGTLFFQLTSDNKFYKKKFTEGSVKFDPVFADYDGDSKTDFAFYQPDTGYWHIYFSSLPGNVKKVFYGNKGDLPIPTDLNGDGQFELTIWRPHTGAWVVNKYDEEEGNIKKWLHGQGGSQDSVCAIDYDGDHKSDLVVWRPPEGYWFIDISTTEYSPQKGAAVQFGKEWDVLVPNDFNGDGKSDLALWRPEDKTWYFKYAGSKTENSIKFGESGEIPLSSDLTGDGIPELITWNDSKRTWNIYNLRTQETVEHKWEVPGGSVPAITILQMFE